MFKFADREQRRKTVTVSLDFALDKADPSQTPAQTVIAHETRRGVRDMMASLPDGERAVVTLFYSGEWSAADIGACLGINESAVKKRLERGRKRLAERMVAPMSNEWRDTAPSRDTRFVEMARLLREITDVLESDAAVVAAYLAPSGKDEGFGAGNDAWASLNVHAVMQPAAMPALATGRGAQVARVAEPILWVDNAQNAPPQGYYRMAIYDAPAGPYEVDWYWHTQTGAAIPSDARILFNRSVPSGAAQASWKHTPESEYPDALRQAWATRTSGEARAEETRNTVHPFYAMWLISAKYTARDPEQTGLPFGEMLLNLLSDTRRNMDRGERVAPEPLAPAPTLAAKTAQLQTLADKMTALGYTPPAAAPRFLALIERGT